MTWQFLLTLITCYFLVLVVATVAAQPIRKKLVILVDDMLAEDGWSKVERAKLEFTIETCSMARVSLLLPIAALYGLAEAVLKGYVSSDDSSPKLDRDPRRQTVGLYYILSLAGNSPFAFTIALPIVALAIGVLALQGDRHLTDAVELPFRHVRATFQ